MQPVIQLGIFGKPFAVNGWQFLISYTEPAEQILQYQPHLQLQKKGNWQTCTFADIAQQGSKILIRLNDVQTPEQAAVFTRSPVGVLRKHLPPLTKGYYWQDLIGMEVVFQDKHRLYNYGRVQALTSAAGKHDILEVHGADKTRLIPFIEKVYIVKVADDRIWVNWRPDY